MTDQTTEEVKPLEKPAVTATDTEKAADPHTIDPMIEEARAAQAEIDAAEAKGAQDKTQVDPRTPATDQGQKPIMVPKQRLDEVLSERDLLRDQVGYMRGVIDATPKVTAPAKPQEPVAATTAVADKGAPVDEIETAITTAEAKKLALAERYDEGELSTKQWKEQEILVDKEIRELSNRRLEQVRQESKADTAAALTEQQVAEAVTGTALNLQKAHPNVAVIDALSPGVRDGVWNDITAQATRNLASRGVDVRDGNPQTKLKLIEEKAKLTDNLEAFLPGFKAPQPLQTGQANTPGQKKPSDTAIERGKKIDLANSQPPAIGDMGTGSGSAELTDSDIMNMTEDQVADLLKKAPNLLKRITG